MGQRCHECCSRKPCKVVNVIFLTLILSGALGIGIASMFTKWWIRYKVDSKTTDSQFLAGRKSSLIYYTRDRGLFQECAYEKTADTVRNCRIIEYNANTTGCSESSTGFWRMTDLMKSQVGLHVGSLASVGFALYCSLFSLMFGPKMIRFACAAASLALVSNIVAMVIFHVVFDREKSTAIPELNQLYYSWPKILKQQTKEITYGWSYFMMWISTGLSALAVIHTAIVSSCWLSVFIEDDEDDLYSEREKTSTLGRYATDNRSYEDDLRHAREDKPKGPWGFDRPSSEQAQRTGYSYEDNTYPIRY